METHRNSADHLDALSDVELHQTLLRYGLPNIPVTETTRGLLIKRLRTHIKKEKLDRKMNRHSNARQRHTEDSHYGQRNSPKGITTSNESYEFIPSYQRASPKMYAPPPIFASESCEDLRKTNYFNINADSPVPSYNNTSPPPKYNQMQQMGMVGRLLSFRESTLKRKPPPPIQSSALSNDAPKMSYRSAKTFREAAPSSLKQFFSRFRFTSQRGGTQHSIISQVLVGAFFVFFIAIALIYASMDYSSAIREKNTLSVVCDHTKNDTTKSQQDCIEKENLSKALLLYKELLNMLQDRIKDYYCVNRSTSMKLRTSDFINSKYEDGDERGERSVTTVLHDMEHLINNNPQWKIGITDINGHPATISDKTEPTGHDDTYFMLLKPNLPMFCIFVNKLKEFFTIIGIATLLGGFFALCYGIYCYVRQQKRMRDELTERFASEIINELIDASKRGYDEEIVVINLRDKLLPLNNRNPLLKPWQNALNLLESNESRIQFGLKLKNGEEVRTIKWVGGTPETQNDISKTKKWQSPAFDNRNQVIHPPTPCLKIRHMFDCTEVNNPNLSQLIYNAIVEKVGPKCKILDIQLDKQTCCVYVRCATEADAGAIHNEINGWWFDKRLVSIKFLRLERYLSRFPKSRVSLNG